MPDTPERGLSELDRVALRVVSAIMICGIVYTGNAVNQTKTDVAVIKNQIETMNKSVNTEITRLRERINTLERAVYLPKEKTNETAR